MSEFAYDEVQYQSHPYRQSHPEHLYTLAKLFGLNPVDYKKARVLELGCASGGNIIPIAYNYPDCKIVGIDLSAKQIEAGKAQVNILDLPNIDLRTLSIMDIDQSLGKFDYIICHGIYSWVPEEVRAKILEIFKENLAPEGVAYISYNTYPGWNMVQSIRDMMLYHTKDLKTPQEKATQARALLQFLVDGLEGENTSYSAFLHQEIELLKKQPDSYLLHDHLEEVNFPVYFHEFMSEANKNTLDYLSDAQPSTMFVGNLPEKIAKTLSEVTNIIRSSQYMDFIRNQRFRSTLLCLNTVKINRNISSNAIQDFYLTYMGGRPKAPITLADIVALDHTIELPGAGIMLTVRHPVSKMAMVILQEQNRVPIAYNDFVEILKAKLIEHKLAPEMTHDVALLNKHLMDDLNIMRLVFGGLVELTSSPALYSLQYGDKPKVTRLVQEQARVKTLVTNQRHEVIKLNDFERVLIQLLDGKMTQKGVADLLIAKVQKGELTLTDDQKNKVTDPKQISEKINAFCEQTYKKFAQSALLIN